MKNLLRIVLFLLISVSVSNSVFAKMVKGNGNIKSENREVSNFDAIKVSGAFKVILSQNDDYSLKITADENLLEIIKTKVKNDILYISTEKDIYKSNELTLYIGFKHLSKLIANGANTIKNNGIIRFDDFYFETNGASTASLHIKANQLDIENSGASTIKLEGKSKIFNVDINGAGSVNAVKLESEKCEINISGVGSGKVYATKELKVDISGIGSVKYKGSPDKIISDVSFLGTLKKY